jgi:hypothetical protein
LPAERRILTRNWLAEVGTLTGILAESGRAHVVVGTAAIQPLLRAAGAEVLTARTRAESALAVATGRRWRHAVATGRRGVRRGTCHLRRVVTSVAAGRRRRRRRGRRRCRRRLRVRGGGLLRCALLAAVRTGGVQRLARRSRGAVRVCPGRVGRRVPGLAVPAVSVLACGHGLLGHTVPGGRALPGIAGVPLRRGRIVCAVGRSTVRRSTV